VNGPTSLGRRILTNDPSVLGRFGDSFQPLEPACRVIQFDTMKGLVDLAPIAAAPALRRLVVAGMPQLRIESFRRFSNQLAF
jgi:hypothetical protein